MRIHLKSLLSGVAPQDATTSLRHFTIFIIALLAIIAGCAGIERDPSSLYSLGVEYHESVVPVATFEVRLPSPAISGFVLTVEVPNGTSLACGWPNDINEALRRCERLLEGKYLVMAADVGDYWNGTPQRARLVTLRVMGEPPLSEGNIVKVNVVQIDGEGGELLPIEGMSVSLE